MIPIQIPALQSDLSLSIRRQTAPLSPLYYRSSTSGRHCFFFFFFFGGGTSQTANNCKKVPCAVADRGVCILLTPLCGHARSFVGEIRCPHPPGLACPGPMRNQCMSWEPGSWAPGTTAIRSPSLRLSGPPEPLGFCNAQRSPPGHTIAGIITPAKRLACAMTTKPKVLALPTPIYYLQKHRDNQFDMIARHLQLCACTGQGSDVLSSKLFKLILEKFLKQGRFRLNDSIANR